MKKLRIVSMLLGVALFAASITGCAQNLSDEKESEEELTELSYYMMNDPVSNEDFKRIMKKANEIIEEKIDVRLNLIMLDEASYPDRLNLMIKSGEYYDMAFTGNWGGLGFYENAAKGAFADLTDLFPKYAPETYSRIPEYQWKDVTVDGKIVASVNYQVWDGACKKGFKFRADLADEINFNWKAIKGKNTLDAMKMFTPYLEQSLKNHPEMIGFETRNDWNLFTAEPIMWDMQQIGDPWSPGWIYFEDSDKVFNQFETQEFFEYCTIMRDWYNKRLVRKDGATLKEYTSDRKAGKVMMEFVESYPDTLDAQEKNIRNPDAEKMSETIIKNGKYVAPSYSIATSRMFVAPGGGSNT